ncbi:MAG TPA: glycosyltransferase family 1 protein [bacterium]|nr:glycosyltransferase family 1 protein [bacterium]HEX68653.1 glycosyltransferase family 1 protein [bacterium]
MRIIYLSTDPDNSPFSNKGAGVHIREMTRAWEKLGHSVRIITTAGEEKRDNVWFFPPIRKKWLGKDFSRILTQLKILPFLIKNVSLFKPSLIYERYDFYSFAGVIVARLFHIPHFLEINAPLRWGPRRRFDFPSLVLLAEKIIFSLTSCLILTTGNLKVYLSPSHREKAEVIPDGADEELFHPCPPDTELREKLKIKDGEKVVGFVGSLSPRQGLEMLLDVLPDDCTLLVVGEGRERKKLEEKSKGKKVIFTGPVSHREIPRYISIMDLCILPDMSIYSSPVKLFEYMAMGKAILAPRKGQIKDFFEKSGELFLFTPRDKEEMETSIRKLLKDDSLRSKLGSEARQRFLREFTWKKLGERVLQLLDTLKESHGRR